MSLLFNRQKKKKLPCAHQQALVFKPTENSIAEVKHSPNPDPRTDASEINTSVIKAQPQTIEPPEVKTTGRCQICRKEQLAARYYRIRLIAGLFFPFALQALDLTIVASALPWIASDFHELSQMNWIISAFSLTSATFIPFWGQMADIFGRTASLEAALVLIMIGSALCTSAPTTTFPMLILGRAIQGLAAAGITVIVRIILADKVSLKENAKNTSIFSLVGGLSFGFGPVIGGYLTENNWRWCFGINLPVAFVGVILVFFLLRPQLLGPQPLPQLADQEILDENSARKHRYKTRISMIDFGGQSLFLVGMGLLILALTWGGASYSWHSTHVIPPLVLGTILVICFIFWEYLMVPGRSIARKFPLQQPTIPWELLRQRNMGLLFYIAFSAGLATTAVLYFVDIYFTLVKGYTASKAGIQLLYYTPGLGVGVYLAMYMCNIYPRSTLAPLLLGSLIEALGLTILTISLKHGHIPTIYGMMGLTGAGTGLRFMPGSLHGIGFFPNKIASVMVMTSFAFPFGGTVGMTLMETVFNNKFSSFSSGSVGGFGSGNATTGNFTGSGAAEAKNSSFIEEIDSLPKEIQDVVRGEARDAIVWSFVAILPLMWLCVVAAALLGNVRITRERRVIEDESNAKGKEMERVDWGGQENVTEGVFLWEVLRGRIQKGKGKVEKRPAENTAISDVEKEKGLGVSVVGEAAAV